MGNAADRLAAELLGKCRNDPELFADTMYPWGVPGTPLENKTGPRDWQRRILRKIKEHLNGPDEFKPLRISIASGHGIGKSALMAMLLHWGMTTCVDARGVITANTEGQLRTKTWPESRKWFEMLAVKGFFEMEGTTFKSRDPAHKANWRFDAIPWSATNPEAFAGMHNEGNRILILFDEASAIDDKIWEVVEGALTDENTQIIWVVFGNPTRSIGRFFQTHHLHARMWYHESIDSRDVEGTNKAQLQEWVDLYGIESDFVRVRVRGLFANSGSNQLISTEDVLKAQKRDGNISPGVTDPLIFGLDVARYGTDESVLATRRGPVAGLPRFKTWSGLSSVQLAEMVAAEIKLHQPDYVFVDGGGVGGGVVDLLQHWGFDADEIMFGGSSPKPEYGNRRAYMWVEMREWLTGEVSIPWNDPDLFQQLTQQTYIVRDNKQNDLILTAKEAMRRDGMPSPDRADALALTFAMPVAPVLYRSSRGHTDAYTAETEYVPGWE